MRGKRFFMMQGHEQRRAIIAAKVSIEKDTTAREAYEIAYRLLRMEAQVSGIFDHETLLDSAIGRAYGHDVRLADNAENSILLSTKCIDPYDGFEWAYRQIFEYRLTDYVRWNRLMGKIGQHWLKIPF